MRLRRLAPALAAVAVASLLVPLVQSPATAAPKPVSGYLALGDSVPDAYGVAEEQGYVALLARALGAEWRHCGAGGCSLPTENLAVSGATTSTLIQQQLPSAVATLRARNGNKTPVDDVRLVTITIGGNDLFRPTIEACQVPDPRTGGPSPTCLQTVGALLQQFGANLDQVLGRLSAAGQGRTTIAVSTYYNALVGCPLQALAPLAAQVLEGPLPGAPSLNQVIRLLAAKHGAVVAETGHLVGAAQLQGDCLHPNAAGHAAIAGAFVEAVTG